MLPVRGVSCLVVTLAVSKTFPLHRGEEGGGYSAQAVTESGEIRGKRNVAKGQKDAVFRRECCFAKA